MTLSQYRETFIFYDFLGGASKWEIRNLINEDTGKMAQQIKAPAAKTYHESEPPFSGKGEQTPTNYPLTSKYLTTQTYPNIPNKKKSLKNILKQ